MTTLPRRCCTSAAGARAYARTSIGSSTHSSTISPRPTRMRSRRSTRRLPLSPVRRHRVGVSVLAEGVGPRQAARRRPDPPARDLRQGHQRGDQEPPLRHDHHDACVPGQLPLPWISEGGYAPSPRCCSAGERRRQFPRIRHRAGRRLRAAAVRAEGQQADRARPHDLEIRNSWRRKRTSRSASRRRRITSHSTSSAPRRSAAMPRPRKATCRPRPPNGTR